MDWSKYDYKVIRFINSIACSDFASLKEFLKLEKLPLMENWLFYYFGKKNILKDDPIQSRFLEGYIIYEGQKEISHWKTFLSFTTDDVINLLLPDFIDTGPGPLEDPFIYRKPIEIKIPELKSYLPEDNIMVGWNFVEHRVEYDLAEEEFDKTGKYPDNSQSESYDWYDPFEGHGNWGQGDGF